MFVPMGLIGHDLSLTQIMAWRRTRDNPLPESMMTYIMTTYMRQ